MRIYAKKVCNMEIVRDPVAADVPVAVGPTRRMFYFLRMLYRICNPILLSIRIFNHKRSKDLLGAEDTPSRIL